MANSARVVLLSLIILVAPPVLFNVSSTRSQAANENASAKTQKASDSKSEAELNKLAISNPGSIFKELKARDRVKLEFQRGTPLREPLEKESKNPDLAKFSDIQLYNALEKRSRGLFGSDDRKEVSDLNSGDPFESKVKENARSVGAFVDKTLMKQGPDGSFTISANSLGKRFKLCSDELFMEQTSCSYCTGFLVAPDLFATAGHCLDEKGKFDDTFIVFDYQTSKNEPNGITRYKPDQVYSIKEFVKRTLVDRSDWGLLRLDRPVVGRRPLKVRTSGTIANEDQVYVLGFPEGLPMKVARNGKIIDNSQDVYFTDNVDTLKGNSGSPVFNQETHVVEGINVRGQPSVFEIWQPDGSLCNKHLTFDESKVMGNHASRIDRLLSDLPEAVKAEIVH